MSTLSTFLLLAALTAADDVVLVQFSSDNCPACRTMQPTVARLIDAGYPVQTINIDQQPEYGRQFRIQGVPTFVLMVKGRETQRAMGATGYDKLVQMFAGMRPNSPSAATVVRGQSPETSLVAQPPAEVQPPASAALSNPVSGYQVSAAATQDAKLSQLALQATVRLKVEDDTGFGYGTGTIIDIHDQEALVVTCGHLFRASQGKGAISADLFAPGATAPVAGQLLAYDLDRDIALVSIRPGIAIQPMQVAPPGYAVQPRDSVFTMGCDKGADPSVRESHISGVNRYQGPPNFTVAGQPCDGRSGGGLFSSEGMLIGICNAADPQDDEGIYAALGSIHWQLDQMQLSEIYRRGATAIAAAPPATVLTPSHDVQPAAFAAAIPNLPPQMPTAAPATRGIASDPDAEVIVIVRSRSNPRQPSEVYSLDGAPPELLARIAERSRLTPQNAPGEPTVVRGQSAE